MNTRASSGSLIASVIGRQVFRRLVAVVASQYFALQKIVERSKRLAHVAYSVAVFVLVRAAETVPRAIPASPMIIAIWKSVSHTNFVTGEVDDPTRMPSSWLRLFWRNYPINFSIE